MLLIWDDVFLFVPFFGYDDVIVRGNSHFRDIDKLVHCPLLTQKNKVRSFCLCFSRSQRISVWEVCEIMPKASCTQVPAHVEEAMGSRSDRFFSNMAIYHFYNPEV